MTPAAGGGALQPPERRAALRYLGADGPVLQPARAQVIGPADPSLVDQLPGQRHRRHAPVVEPDHTRPPRGLGRGHHRRPLLRVHRQRLLARHHLAGGQRRQGDIAMRAVRRADVDQVHVRPLHHAAPVGVGLLPPPARGERRQCLRRAGGRHLQHRLERQVEEAPDLPVGVGVGAPHEAVADDRDVQRCGHCQLLGLIKTVVYAAATAELCAMTRPTS